MNKRNLEKYLKGVASTHEKEEVMRWIESDEKNKSDFLELRKLYDISIWNVEEIKNEKENKHIKVNFLLKIAAVSLVIISLGLSYFTFSKQETDMSVKSITCPQGQYLELVLSEGTKVWLNSSSTISFQQNNKEKTRIVELDGEAYFDVAHDPGKPFIVKTEVVDIRVLGTSFNVFSYKNSNLFECSLVEGSVSLKNKNDNTEVKLQPNEKFQIADGIISHTQTAADEEFLWKVGIYSFRNQALSEVFTHLSLLHEVNILLKNQKIGEEVCTGKFRNKDGIEHAISTLQKKYQFTYEKDEKTQTYTIY